MIHYPGFNQYEHLYVEESDPKKRDKQYFYKNVLAAYSDYLKGTSTIGFYGLDKISLLRRAANGEQIQVMQADPAQQVMSPILDLNGNPVPTTTDIYPTYNPAHEAFRVMSPAGKILDALEGTLSKIEYEISADPIDYNTVHETEQNKLSRWAYTKNREKIQFAAQVAGVEIPDPEFLPERQEDLDEYYEEFLPSHVKYIEQIVKHTFDVSHFDPDTKKLFYRDLFTLNFACIRNEYDPEDGKVKPVYVDPAMADIQKSQWMDCRDSEKAWHFEYMSISRLRQYFPDKPEEFFKNLAESLCGMFENPASQYWKNYTVRDEYGIVGYDAFKALVFNYEWIDIDTSKQLVYNNKYGRKIVKNVPLSTKASGDKKERFYSERVRYSCKWLVGQDEIFEYGPDYDNFPSLTYKWIVLPGKSKIEQLLPILVQFQDLWDRLRELIRNAQGKGMALDIDMLASTAGENDNVKEAQKKAFRRFLATDKMLFRRINAAGLPNQNMPIVEFDGGMGSFFQEIQQAIKINMEMIEYISGLNPLSLGSTPDANAPVTTSQISMNATSNVLRPLVEGYMREKQQLAEDIARWVVVLIRGNEFSRNAYMDVVGEYGVESLVAASKIQAAYGIRLKPRPNDIEKQWLLQNLQAATTPAQGGEREISTADANLILNMIAAGSPVKTIQFYFEKARRKQRAAIMSEKKQLMETQSQLNQRDAQTSMQARMQEQQANHAMNMELQAKKNEGVTGDTVVREQLRKDKDVEVQRIKNEGIKEKEPVSTI